MKKSLKAICVGLALFNCFGSFAESYYNVVPPFTHDALDKDGIYRVIHKTNENDYILLPDCEFKNTCETERVVKKQKKYFPFVAEIIYKINKEDLKTINETTKDDFKIFDVSKALRSISKMQGMTYYSSTRRKRVTLYEKAYTIESEANPVPIPDETGGSADKKVIYAFLDDASFGPCRYELSYFENENAIFAQFTNLDTMGVGPIKAIKPHDMLINLIVVDCGENFVLYLGTDVDCLKFPGVSGQLEDSLISRLDAIYNWFLHQF